MNNPSILNKYSGFQEKLDEFNTEDLDSIIVIDDFMKDS